MYVMDSGLIVCDDICCVKFYKLLFMECIFVCCFSMNDYEKDAIRMPIRNLMNKLKKRKA